MSFFLSFYLNFSFFTIFFKLHFHLISLQFIILLSSSFFFFISLYFLFASTDTFFFPSSSPKPIHLLPFITCFFFLFPESLLNSLLYQSLLCLLKIISFFFFYCNLFSPSLSLYFILLLISLVIHLSLTIDSSICNFIIRTPSADLNTFSFRLPSLIQCPLSNLTIYTFLYLLVIYNSFFLSWSPSASPFSFSLYLSVFASLVSLFTFELSLFFFLSFFIDFVSDLVYFYFYVFLLSLHLFLKLHCSPTQFLVYLFVSLSISNFLFPSSHLPFALSLYPPCSVLTACTFLLCQCILLFLSLLFFFIHITPRLPLSS
ncbi:unnamed protein product [Acanthosepion pharaonis]|uniref:Uncharacterized protein n=1 Tax=Acanthosepion pharaonis TaxID=158019 RepID=A0A812DMQ8_ACAPH|nr:unnamed protein product [Sepia pharaonis]